MSGLCLGLGLLFFSSIYILNCIHFENIWLLTYWYVCLTQNQKICITLETLQLCVTWDNIRLYTKINLV